MEVVKKNFFSGITFTVVIVLLLPILFIVRFSFDINYEEINYFINSKLVEYVKNTLKIALFTSLFSIILGVVPAYIISIYNVKYSRVWDLLMILPLSIPCYIMSFIYADFFGFQGLFFNFLRSIQINIMFDVLKIEFLSLFFALSLFPYLYVTSRISFNLIGNNYLELSKTLGLTRFEILKKVILPLSFSGIYSGLLLVIMEVFNEYGAVHYFGIETFSNGIFKYWFSLDNKNISLLLSLILIIIILFFLYLNVIASKVSKNISKTKLILLGSVRKKSIKSYHYVFLFLPVFLGFFFPFILVLKGAIASVQNYNFVEIIQPTINTIFLGTLSSFLIVFTSFFILKSNLFNKSSFTNFFSILLTSGYAIPGAIIGLSIMLGIESLGIGTGFLIGSISVLVYSYLFRFISVSFFSLKSSFDRQPITLDEQAKILKMNYIQRVLKLHIPLSKFALIYAAILIFVDVAKELPLTLILRPFNFETLATQTYQYANEEMLSQSSIYSLTLIVICAILLIIAQNILNKHELLRNKKN